VGASLLGAQGTGPLVLAGRVVRVAGHDTTALAEAMIVAHHIGVREQGPVDSLRSDAAGRFRFRVASPDTGGMYVVSTLYAGIGYFSEPVPARERAGADTVRLAVYDTSSSGAPLEVGMRHVVVSAPAADGSRDVLDIVQVANPGATTRVSRGTAPTWRMLLPRGVQSFHLGDSDVPATAVQQAGDTVAMRAPVPPGVKQLVMTYVLPGGSGALRVPIDQPTVRLELLVEDSGATASGATLAAANPVQLEGRTFRRFSASRIAAGEAATVSFGSHGGSRRLAWVAIVLAAGLLGIGGWAAARRRSAAVAAGTPAAPAPDGDAVLRQIVALDERYASRQADTPPAEWEEYQRKRAALKAELAGRLARR